MTKSKNGHKRRGLGDLSVRIAKWSVVLAPCIGCSAGSNADGGGGSGGTSGAPSSGGSSGSGAAGTAGTSGSSGSSGTSGATSFDCSSNARPGALVNVPAGAFIMGCNAEADDQCGEDEKPMHTVTLSAFSIERTEVTQDAYAACVTDGACEPPSCVWNCDDTDLPATCVGFEQAQAYCAWADRRLPTEAEWEKAARGTDGAVYPWGNDAASCALVNMAGCGDEAMPVGSFPDGASPYGALDMAGNMVEMVSDWYDAGYYADSPSADPTGPASGSRYVGRGGGFKSDAEWQRASKRDWYDLVDNGASLGFRCAR
jgi:formylglycine-generating enzyme required for sulfatase activity